MSLRAKLLFPVVLTLVAGTLLFLFASTRTELTCDRATATCDWRDGVIARTATTIPMKDVREVRYVGGRGKYGNDGHVELVLASGEELVFGKGDDDAAKATTERAQAFFAGTAPAYRYQTAPRTWMYFLGSSFFVFAAGLLLTVVAGRKVSKADVAKASADPAVRRGAARMVLVGMTFFLLAIAGSIVSCVSSDVTDTLAPAVSS